MQWSRVQPWILPLIVAGVIFYASSQPSVPKVLPAWPHIDKLAHFGIYGVLSVAILRALVATSSWRLSLRGALWAIVLAALYGVSDELYQGYVPGRQPDVLDWMADILGATAGIITYCVLRRERYER